MTMLPRPERCVRVGRKRLLAGCALICLGALAGCAETQLGAQVAKSFARAGATEDGGASGAAEADGAERGAAEARDGGPAAANGGAEAPRTASADPKLAPEVFDATGLTIWDGASTLQGVWFAHPLAQRAQRARIYNLKNGVEMEGALFRRDPSISGPSILLSSDAARALGVTPGDPTELRIVALREGPAARESVVAAAAPITIDPSPAAEVEPEAVEPPPPVEEVEAEAVNDSGIELAETSDGSAPRGPSAVESAALAPPVRSGAEVTESDDTDDEGATGQSVAEAPDSGDLTADAPEGADIAAVSVEARPEPLAASEEAGAADAASETVESAARSPAPAARPNRPASQAPAAEPASPPATVAASDTETAAAPSPASGKLAGGRYLQIGTFSVEGNAKALVGRLRDRGQPAAYVVRTLNGAPYSIVVVGPLPDAASLDAARAASAAEGQKQPLEVSL